MKGKKYTLFNFCTGDFKGVERYLNAQAARGWKLDKVGLLLGRFSPAGRDDLHWCVDLVNPRREREAEEEYLGLCAEGGWDLAAKTNNMYLFCSRPGLNPGPVQTEPELERKNYFRYYVRSAILSVLIVAGVLAVWALLLSWAAARRRCWWATVLLTLPPLLPAVLSGVMPAWGSLVALAAVRMGLLLQSSVRNTTAA